MTQVQFDALETVAHRLDNCEKIGTEEGITDVDARWSRTIALVDIARSLRRIDEVLRHFADHGIEAHEHD